MANEFKIKKGLIVTGASGGTVVDIQGSQGQLFSVTDDLSGSIFAVSDISGVPILDINSSGISYFDGTVGIGTSSPGKKLEVKSDITYDGIQISGSSIPTLAIIDTTNNAKLVAYARDSDATIGTETNHTLTINTNNTTALTLDTSQNATFAGNVSGVAGTFTGNLAVGNTSAAEIYLNRNSANYINASNAAGYLVFRTGGTTTALTLNATGAGTFGNQAFATTATSSGDASSTLTTKGYVDGLITGATIYRGAWQAGISATSSAATTASTTLTVTAAILDADGNTPVLVGAVVTGEGITGIVKVASVTSSTVYVLDTAITATATAYIFSPIYGAPDLSGVTETSGYYYICSEAGSATPNGANSEPNTWAVGDWCIYNDVSGTGQWQKIDNSSVLSGAGTGQTVALWEGPSSVTDSETLGNAPITVSGSDTTFAQDITARIGSFKSPDATSSILMNLMANDGANAATFRTTSTGKIFEIQSQNSGTLKFTSPISWYTGKIGIGTNGPVADLQVLSTKDGMTNGLNTNQLKLSYGASVVGAGSSVAFGVSSNLNFTGAKIVHERTASNSVGDLTFWTRQTGGTSTDYDLTIERMRIKSDGNIQLNAYGAGTLVTDASGNITTSSGGGAGGPYLPLSAGSSYPLTGELFLESDLTIDNATGDPYIKFKTVAQEYVVRIDQSDSEKFQIRDTTNSLTRITLDTSGEVGIGNTNPADYGADANNLVVGSLSGNNGITILSTSSSGYGSIFFADASTGNKFKSGFIRYQQNISDMTFGTNEEERMRLTLEGYLGIDDTNPNAKLQVDNGAIKIRNIVDSSPGSNVRRNINIATFDGQGSTFTGKLIIETPVMTTGAMATFKISGWQYDESWDLTVSGYLRFGTGRGWEQIGGAILTGNPPFDIDEVRLCYNDTTNIYYIILGDASTFWDYYASIVINADSYYQDSIPTTGWDMSVATADPTGLTDIVTLTNIAEYGSSNAIIPGSVAIGTYTPLGRLGVVDGDAQMIFGSASSARPWLRLKHNVAPADGEEVGLLDFNGFNDANQDTRYAIFSAKAEDVSDGTEDGSLTLLTMKAGTLTNTLTGRSGNVGIGRTTPAVPLDVEGKIRSNDDSSNDYFEIFCDGSGSGDSYIENTSNNIQIKSAYATSFSTSGSAAMFIDNNQKVGIGNTSPDFRLHTNLNLSGTPLAYLNGTANTFDGTVNLGVTHNSTAVGTGTGAGVYLANNANNDGAPSPIIAFSALSASGSYNHTYAAIYGIKTAGGADTNWVKGDLTFATGNTTGPERRMTILANGNVGIGTISPNSKLQVVGKATSTSTVSTDAATTLVTKDYVDSSAGNPSHFRQGHKSHNLTNAFTTCLTVNLSNHTSCYVTVCCFGDWGSHSAAAYRGEFFLQNGANSYNEPGIILRQDDNTSNSGDQIVCQILDPTSTANPKNFEIQIRTTATTGTTGFTGLLTFTVQGKFNSVT